MKPQPFATKWRVVFSLFASCGIFALPSHAATCSSSNLPTGPTAYIATSPNLVTVLDASTNTTACTIIVGTHPTNLAVSPDGSQLFVENDTDATVSVIDLASGAVTSTIDLSTAVSAPKPFTANLAVSPDGTAVYVVVLPQTVVSGTTKAALYTISLPSLTASAPTSFNSSGSLVAVTGSGLGIAFSTDGVTAYIATEGQTYVVATSTNTITSASAVNGGTVVTDPAHSPSSFAYVVDVASGTNSTVTEIAALPNPPLTTTGCTLANSSAITPNGAFDYYTCPGNNFVQKIDTSTNTVSGTGTVALASGAGPHGVAISTDGASAYVANSVGTISVVSVSGNSVTTTIAGSAVLAGIGFRPVQLSIAPASQNVPTGTKFQFTSTLRYAFGSVTWSVLCTTGGAACGTVDSTGNYTAPNSIPSPNDVKVIATSTEIPLKSLKYPSQSVSAAVTITPSQLAFKVEPVNGVAGSPLATVTVAVEDASGNTDTSSTASITISSTSAPLGAASVTGTTMVNAVAGVATFSSLILSQVGTTPLATTPYTYTLTATSLGLAGANSTPAITIIPGAPAQLVFSTQPASGTAAGNALTNVVVYVEDSDNNVVTSGTGSNASVTMTPASTPSGIATFSAGSTNPVSALGGVATFSNLILTQANIPPSSGSTTVTTYNYTMTAASATPALTSPPSNSFTVLPATATKLAFTTQPANGTAGVALGPFIAVVEDTFNNVLTSGAGSNASVAVTSTAAPATPAAAPASGTVVASGGVATFSNLILTQVGTTPLATTKYNYTLTAMSGPLTPAISTPTITIVPGAPTQLAFATEPMSGTPAGSPLAPVVLYVEDATGLNVVTSGPGSNASVTMTSSATPATPLAAPLGGTPAATAMNGVATFSNLILTQVGTTPLGTTPYNYTLTAKSSGLTSANSTPAITIVPGAAAQLVFNTQPASGTPAGNALVPVVVYVEDATGLNVVTSGAGSNALITMTPASTPPGITTFSAGSANSVFAANGVATFSALILAQANIPPPSGSTTVTTYNYTMTAASATPASTSPPSNPFTILPATAAKLVFATEPAAVGSLAGSPLSPAPGPVVTVEDNFGNALTSGPGSNALITITSATMPAAPVAVPLGGTTMVAATGGVAAFSNLLLTQVGTTPLPAPATVYNYSLTAKPPITFPSVASATSTPFVIAPGAPTQLAFATEPVSGAAAGSPLAPVTVYVEDATGLNVVTNGPPGSNPSITISSSATPGSPLAAPVGGAPTVVATGGVATFSNLILTQVGTTPLATTVYNYTLTAKSSGLTSANSTPAITIVPGAPTQLVFNTQPVSGTTAGNALVGVVVYVEDATGVNVVTSGPGSNASITMTPASTPSGITTFFTGTANPVSAVGGVATFGNLILTQANIPPGSGSTMPVTYNYTMTAASTAPTLTSPASNQFTILPALATKLVYTTEPANGTAGIALGAVNVAVEDTFKNVVTTGTGSNASVTITSSAAPASPTAAPIGGLTTATAMDGVATFSGLILTQVGTTPLAATKYNYILTAASGSLTSASSAQSITIVPGAATQLVFNTQPSGTTAGNALATVVVYVEDVTSLNVVTSDGSTVSMTSHAVMPAGTGGLTSDSTATVTAASGVAAFTNLKPTRSATLTLSASDGTLAGATSNPFAVIGNPAGLIAGSAGIDQTNPLAIPRSSDMASATIDLLGPTPSDAVTFTVSCAVTMAGALNPPHCSTSPASTTGTDGGVTPISVTLLAFGGSSVPAEHAKPFFLGPQTGLPEFETIALLLAVGLFGLLRIRFVQATSPRSRCGVAFMFLLCVSLGWMSGCTQFSPPNAPATPIPPTPTGPGSAVVTITPSGAGPGSDAYTTKTVTVYFNVQ